MKIAPLLRALEPCEGVRASIIHTGQHYDAQLSDVFFRNLGLPEPAVTLGVGSGSHAEQTARILCGMEAALREGVPRGEKVDRLVVVGDVNSTMAATLAAAKLGVPVAHVEAGLRSFDRTMPEEINRVVTDSLADMLLVSEPAGVDNLRREGHDPARIHLVGNVMIDTLRAWLDRAKRSQPWSRFGLTPKHYGVVTLHRPSNVDSPARLASLVEVLLDASARLPMLFPLHPRARPVLDESRLLRLLEAAPGIHLVPPLGYLDFLGLVAEARVAITDSGGLQEETTALGVPCLTVRSNTERPITVDEGTSTLVAAPEALREALDRVLHQRYKKGRCPALWDGNAARRIAAILAPGRSTQPVAVLPHLTLSAASEPTA
jgi:UDP-N-acetylglucosamine 2-epimerase (non-hydrolysing)